MKTITNVRLTDRQWFQLQRSLHNDWLDNTPTDQKVIENVLEKLGATPVTEPL